MDVRWVDQTSFSRFVRHLSPPPTHTHTRNQTKRIAGMGQDAMAVTRLRCCLLPKAGTFPQRLRLDGAMMGKGMMGLTEV